MGLSLPIIGGMVSQNVLNLVDTAMVGTLGEAALAAVGQASFLNFMFIAFITGLSSGVQAIAARRKGERRHSETAVPLNGGLLLALLLGVPMTAAFVVIGPLILPLLNDDPAVVEQGVPYLLARLSALVAVGMNFSFRGYWNAVDRSNLYMSTLVFMHAANIALSYCLIFGKLGAPELGTLGAGIGTAIATWLGTATYAALGVRYALKAGFLTERPTLPDLRSMLKLALPTSIQQLLFATGFTVLFAIIAYVGTTEVAAASVLINVTLVGILPGLGMGLAAASLVGQALGSEDPEDARRWGWDVSRVAVAVMALIGLPMLLVPDLCLSPFLHEPATLDVARLPLRIVGATIAIDGIGMVLLQALLGAGAARQVAVVSIGLQWGLFLPAAAIVGPVLGGGLLAIWIAQAIQRALQAAVFAWIWQRGSWAKIKL